MAATQRTLFGTAKIQDLVWSDGTSPDALQNAISLPNVCAACHGVLGNERCLLDAFYENGFRRWLTLAELRVSAETGGCRLCGIFLCAAVYSVARDDPFYALPVSRFLNAYGALQVRITVCVNRRYDDLARSDRDVHELLVYGAVRRGGDVRTYWFKDGIPFKFRVYAREGDEAVPAYISLTECDGDLDSDAAVTQIRSWMAACDENHSFCSHQKSGPLPTRVLDVSNLARLRLCDVDGDDCRYAALSYCWGGGNQVKTTKSSLKAAYSAINLSSLPLAIQDAVKVTQRIGLAHLWVDALCIVQDCPPDMEREIGKMAYVYRNAAVTIMAANIRRLWMEGWGDTGRYLAGLWENDLLDELSWYTVQGYSREVRGKNVPYRAPSWSWVSVDCSVKHGGGGTPWPAGIEMEILECDTVLRSELLPMGQVLGGRLRVRGSLLLGSDVPRPETWELATSMGNPLTVMLRMDGFGAGDHDAVAKARSCAWLRLLNTWGLVLERVGGNVYRRVGAVNWSYWARKEARRAVVEII
ncbi:heterokaryon incompatibility protein [Colletotrichum plurivorum]|uniref:Heterokaryon incompatibility protein n=1 Tax=Colletotrichum plurivorum TaxID=2175906 RepID=A0A8H6KT35_9PEZI|nr:heterokaryon incompatibility protein [Colletotrichum plurivorum]